MVAEVRVYFEGHNKLRAGFHSFLNSVITLARSKNIRFQLVACGDRANTIRDFITAIRVHRDSAKFMLIDSDCPDDGALIATVKGHTNWDSQGGAAIEDTQIQFMVQIMEAWFLADREALISYYGQGFLENRLPGNTRVEEVPSGHIIQGLEAATQNTRKGKYHKTRHAPDLLAQVDVSKVRSTAPSCERLFKTLERAVYT